MTRSCVNQSECVIIREERTIYHRSDLIGPDLYVFVWGAMHISPYVEQYGGSFVCSFMYCVCM